MLPSPCNFFSVNLGAGYLLQVIAFWWRRQLLGRNGSLNHCQERKLPLYLFLKASKLWAYRSWSSMHMIITGWQGWESCPRGAVMRTGPDKTLVCFLPHYPQPTHRLPLSEHLDWNEPALWDPSLPWNCSRLVWPGDWGSRLDRGVAEWRVRHPLGRCVLGQSTTGKFQVR